MVYLGKGWHLDVIGIQTQIVTLGGKWADRWTIATATVHL